MHVFRFDSFFWFDITDGLEFIELKVGGTELSGPINKVRRQTPNVVVVKVEMGHVLVSSGKRNRNPV